MNWSLHMYIYIFHLCVPWRFDLGSSSSPRCCALAIDPSIATIGLGLRSRVRLVGGGGCCWLGVPNFHGAHFIKHTHWIGVYICYTHTQIHTHVAHSANTTTASRECCVLPFHSVVSCRPGPRFAASRACTLGGWCTCKTYINVYVVCLLCMHIDSIYISEKAKEKMLCACKQKQNTRRTERPPELSGVRRECTHISVCLRTCGGAASVFVRSRVARDVRQNNLLCVSVYCAVLPARPTIQPQSVSQSVGAMIRVAFRFGYIFTIYIQYNTHVPR